MYKRLKQHDSVQNDASTSSQKPSDDGSCLLDQVSITINLQTVGTGSNRPWKPLRVELSHPTHQGMEQLFMAWVDGNPYSA